MKTVLVTGAAGFIGYHVCEALLNRGDRVIGVDNLNAYYTPQLKNARLARLSPKPSFTFHHCDIADFETLKTLIGSTHIDAIIHLAAQAGVRHSLQAPFEYVQTNLVGQVSLLELARAHSNAPFVYASSSSVYGRRTDMPLSEEDRTDKPASLYGATKKSGEVLVESYSALYGIHATGLRFFTVYGPWGRPDMAYWTFTDAILTGKQIKIFNQGKMSRDMTWIDDIVAGILGAVARPHGERGPDHRIYNLGNHKPMPLMDMIGILENTIGRDASKVMLPMQPGDVWETFADIEAAKRDLGYAPKTPATDGLPRFVEWFKSWQDMERRDLA
jgi:UDP-glucuronate 4-epimerase